MIGLLQSLGSGNTSIRSIFIWYAAYISIVGIGLGCLLGLGLSWLQQVFHFLKMDESTYYVSYAPISFNWLQIIIVVIATAIVCFLALLLPSYIVSKITPVKALQFK
jgi:lipoprotein-releasing system permease protein